MLSKSIASRSLLAQCVGIGLLTKVLQRFEPKFADPVGILFDVGDVMTTSLGQTDAGVVAVIDLVMKVAYVAIDIDS